MIGWADAFSLMAVLCAATVRGYAGFGFSAVSVGLMSFWMSPSEVIPAIFLLEVPASLLMLRQSLRHFDGKWLLPLIGGSAIGVPLGVMMLASLKGPALQLLVGGTISLVALAANRGWHPRNPDTRPWRWTTGLISGVINGINGMGGIACAVMLLATALEPVILRATLNLLFLFTDLYGLILFQQAGLLSAATARTSLLWLPALVVGIWLGSRLFDGSSTATFRRRVFALLTLLGLGIGLKAVLALLGP